MTRLHAAIALSLGVIVGCGPSTESSVRIADQNAARDVPGLLRQCDQADASQEPEPRCAICRFADQAIACDVLGHYYASGQAGLQKNEAMAKSYHEKAISLWQPRCNASNDPRDTASVCTNLGRAYERVGALSGGISEVDRVRATVAYQKACETKRLSEAKWDAPCRRLHALGGPAAKDGGA